MVLGANALMAETSTRLDALQRAVEQVTVKTTLDADVRAAIVKLRGIREQLSGDNTPGRYSEPTETSLLGRMNTAASFGGHSGEPTGTQRRQLAIVAERFPAITRRSRRSSVTICRRWSGRRRRRGRLGRRGGWCRCRGRAHGCFSRASAAGPGGACRPAGAVCILPRPRDSCPRSRPNPVQMTFWLVVLALSLGLTVYSYALYPLLLVAVRWVHRAPDVMATEPAAWPMISITLPAYNAQETLRPVLEALVRVDYPAERRQILVVSDGSTDGTDALVREYAPQGVELLRVEGRLGKTEVENRAMDSLRGEIVVNTDASVTVRPDAIKRLVAAFGDPKVGVASARDVSVSSVGAVGHASEAAYVGYEMWVRDLETAVDGIIGSSGCLYAIRADLHRRALPGHLSRDFSSALWARLHGMRAVSVREAICFVPARPTCGSSTGGRSAR